MGGGSGVEGIEHGFKVFSKLIEGFVCSWDRGVCKFVIPHFGKVGSLSFTHFVQGSGYLVFIQGVKCGVEGEVGFHSLDPLGCIRGFTREVGREGHFEFTFGGHG